MSKLVENMIMPMLVLSLLGSSGCKKEEPIHPTWITYTSEETGIEDFRTFNICSDPHGNIYAVQSTGVENTYNVFYHKKGTENWTTVEFPFVAHDPYSITDGNHMQSTTDGSVWLLGREEMVRFKDGKVKQTYNLSHLIASGSTVGVSRFATYQDQVWLLHGSYGLYNLNTETGETQHFPQPGYSGINRLLAIDHQGNKWIAKRNYGDNVIALTTDGVWLTANDPDSLVVCPECATWASPAYENFRGMTVDSEGNVFLYDYNYRLFRVSDLTIQGMTLSIGYYFDGMTIDHQDQLWFYKTDRLNPTPQESRLYRYNGGSSPSVVDLTEAFEGNVWPYDLTFDHNNNAWAATNMGIAVYNENGVEF